MGFPMTFAVLLSLGATHRPKPGDQRHADGVQDASYSQVQVDCFRIVLLSLLLSFASPAYADAGVPMLFITLPGMLIALIPIIGIESWVLARTLSLSAGLALKTASLMNVLSTVFGIPVAWLILVVVQMITGGGYAHGIDTPLQKFLAVTWQAPWLIPYKSELSWMVPAATLVLFIPFFFASWFIEYKVAKQMLEDVPLGAVKRATFIANLITYTLLGVAVLGYRIKEV